MNLNSKIDEKMGGAVTDICLFIFLLVQEKFKKISSKFHINHNFIAIRFAHMFLEN